MLERIGISKIGLVNRYHQDFSSQINFTKDRFGTLVECTSSQNFTNSRVSLMDGYLSGKYQKTEMPQALLAEELVSLALKKPLEERGFSSYLAPQNLESGENQKGVDLIITDADHMICLGVDLKLKKGKSKIERDGYGWCQNIQSPFIYLKMGNWSLETREESTVDIRQWISEYTRPKLKTTGKIPRVNELREYIFPRIERTISSYIEILKEPEGKFADVTIPKNMAELNALEDKLFMMHSLFSSISDGYFNRGKIVNF